MGRSPIRRLIADLLVALIGLGFIAEDILGGLAGGPPTYRLAIGAGLMLLALLPWSDTRNPEA